MQIHLTIQLSPFLFSFDFLMQSLYKKFKMKLAVIATLAAGAAAFAPTAQVSVSYCVRDVF